MIVPEKMYRYRSGITRIDDGTGGFDAGMNFLVMAPPMGLGRDLLYALTKPLDEEYAVVVSTNERASEVIDAFRRAGSDKKYVGTIDAITKGSTPGVGDTNRQMFVASPTDLTGIGIKLSRMIELIFNGEFSEEENKLFPPPIRFCVNSLSTFLMYRRLDVLYQFLRALTSKVKKTDGVGFYLISNESFDVKTIALLEQLMDGVIEVKTEGDLPRLCVRGKDNIASGWFPFTISDGKVAESP